LVRKSGCSDKDACTRILKKQRKIVDKSDNAPQAHWITAIRLFRGKLSNLFRSVQNRKGRAGGTGVESMQGGDARGEAKKPQYPDRRTARVMSGEYLF